MAEAQDVDTDGTEMENEKMGTGTKYDVSPQAQERLQEEHISKRSVLQQMVDKIAGISSLKVRAGKGDDLAKKAGVDTSKVPESLRPAYLAVVNFINSPPQRFDQTKEQAEKMIGQMEGLEGEIKVALYGGNYNGLSGKLGGLHKEYQSVGDQRFECARGIQELGKEIGQVFKRIKSTEEARKQETSPDKIKALNERLIGFRFDLDQYEGIKQDLEIKLEGYDRQVKSIGQEIEKADQMRTYIREAATQMRAPLAEYRKAGDYSRIGSELQSLVPRLQQQLAKYVDIIGAMNQQRLEGEIGLAGTISEPINVPHAEELGPSPFAALKGRREQRSERLDERVDEILKDPYQDMYKPGV